MKYVFLSKRGDSLPLAQKIEAENNQVDFYICEDENLVVDRHITSFAPDIIIIDSCGFGALANRLSKAGFPVVGSSLFTDKLESDPLYSEKALKMCGLNTREESGIPVSIDGWFNGKEFISIIYGVDDIISSGSKEDDLFKDGLARLIPVLKKACYHGPVTLKVTLSKDAISFKDLRAQFSANTLLVLKEGLKGKVGDVLFTMAKGHNRYFILKPGWFTLVQVSINPNPLFNENFYYNINTIGLTDDIIKHVWLYGFSKKFHDSYTYTGKGGRIAVVTARGDTIREARRRVYRTLYNLRIPDILFLQKVGQKASAWYANIKQWGYVV